MSNLYIESFSCNYHILVFTETWLNDSYFNAEILCNKYNIFRRDRGSYGGGVLIAVSNDLSCERLPNDSNIEFVAVAVKLKCKKIFVTCSYIPPSSPQFVYSKHGEDIRIISGCANENDSLVILGDFNMPSVSWNFLVDDGYYIQTTSNETFNVFFNILYDLGLFQINGILNDYSRILDLIFVNDKEDCCINRSYPITVPEDRYHPSIELMISIPSDNILSPAICTDKVFSFKNADYFALNELIVNTDWNNLLSLSLYPNGTIENMFNIFYSKMRSFMESCIPKRIQRPLSGPPWNSKQLCRLKNKKNKYYKKYKLSGSTVDYLRYTVCRAEYTKLNRQCYSIFLFKTKNNLYHNPRLFYKFINTKKKSSGLPTTMSFQNTESSDIGTICNLFAEFFSTTYSDLIYDDTVDYPFPLVENQSISLPTLNTTIVASQLKKLKFAYSYGPDNIPSSILINCADALAIPLTTLFNTSIKYGIMPEIWKKSFIVPLFKSGNKSMIENYRCISKLSIIPKLFEKLITDMLYYQVSNLISPFQHGFQKGCSTTTNLLHFTTAVNRGFFHRKQTDVIYTDFSKAFDKVNHVLLLRKLRMMGFADSAIKWIRSYLLNRTQTVCFNNVLSRTLHVSSGVPQGSHLGPLLFTLFINDLPNVIKSSNILLYADDVKIFLTYNNPLDQRQLQIDLNSFYDWCNINLMELNIKKCKIMQFSRTSAFTTIYFLGDYQLEGVDRFLDLGILFDQKMNFLLHITGSINKARVALGYIKRWSKEFNDPYIMKALYMSLVRPILEYGSIIWDPIYQIHSNAIESVQKQFLLFCLRGLNFDALNMPSYSARLALIKLPSLKSRRTMLNVSFLLNVVRGDICSGFLISEISFNIPQRISRNFLPLAVQFYRSNYSDADPLRRMCNEFNKYYKFIDYSQNTAVIKKLLIVFLNS